MNVYFHTVLLRGLPYRYYNIWIMFYLTCFEG